MTQRAASVLEDLHAVLLVDTMSASNDFGVELPLALDPLVALTVFTLKNSRLSGMGCRRVIEAFPEYGGSRSHSAKLLSEVVAILRLVVELWRHRQGTIHVQFFRFTLLEFPVYLLMRPFVRRMVLTVHNALPHETRTWQAWLYRRWYRLQDHFHVLSEHTGRILVESFGVAPGRISLVPHGNYSRFLADHPPADRVTVRRQLGLDPSATVFVFFGLLRPYKGVDLLIDAVSRINAKGLAVLICGGCTSEMAAFLRDKLNAASPQVQVSLITEFLDNQTLSDVIGASDVAVFPYRHVYQSGSLLLAMTYGKAILSNRLPGFMEYVADGESAVMCDTSSATEFAASIVNLSQDEPLRARLGAAAVLLAVERYDWRMIAQQIKAMYVQRPQD